MTAEVRLVPDGLELRGRSTAVPQRGLADALGEGVGRLVLIEGAGHFTWNDAPETDWPLLTEFVESV